MAELVDALASGASARKGVEVRVLFRAPYPKAAPVMGRLFGSFLGGDNGFSTLSSKTSKKGTIGTKLDWPRRLSQNMVVYLT